MDVEGTTVNRKRVSHWSNTPYGEVTDWNAHYAVDGVSGIGGPGNLFIDAAYSGGWAAAEIAIWDRALSETEMNEIVDYYRTYLSTGVTGTPALPPPPPPPGPTDASCPTICNDGHDGCWGNPSANCARVFSSYICMNTCMNPTSGYAKANQRNCERKGGTWCTTPMRISMTGTIATIATITNLDAGW